MLNERGDTIEYSDGEHTYRFIPTERPDFKWEPRGTFIHFPGSRTGTALEYVIIEGAIATLQFSHIRNDRYKSLSIRLKGYKTNPEIAWKDAYRCRVAVKFGDETVDSVNLETHPDPWIVSAPSYGPIAEIEQLTDRQQTVIHLLNRSEPANLIINPTATAQIFLEADGVRQHYTVKDFEHATRGTHPILQRYSVLQIPNEREHHVNEGNIDALMLGDRKLCTIYCGTTD